MFKKWICLILVLLLGLANLPANLISASDFTSSPAQPMLESGSSSSHYVNADGFTSLLSTAGVIPGSVDATVGALSAADASVFEKQGVKLRKAMVDRDTDITLSFTLDDEGLTDETVEKLLLETAVQETGKGTEGDYINYHWATYDCTRSWDFVGSKVAWTVSFLIKYRASASQEKQLTKSLTSLYASLGLSGISNPYKKLLRIYDYITQNIVYDYEHLPMGTGYPLMYTAYAALVNKTAVCQGYALLLYRMLMDNGVPARCIVGSSNGESHMWNIVKIGGRYYNCDSTWDAGSSTYSYFLRGENYFSADHKRNEPFQQGEFLTLYATSYADYDLGAATATPIPTATPTPTVAPDSSKKYPTATLLSKTSQTVKRGKTVKLKFKLKSGSYKKVGDIYRAEFDVRIYNSQGTRVAWNGADGHFYTGNEKHTIKWKVPKTLAPGKYTVNFRTYYNKQTTSYAWYYNKKTTNDYCYITIK